MEDAVQRAVVADDAVDQRRRRHGVRDIGLTIFNGARCDDARLDLPRTGLRLQAGQRIGGMALRRRTATQHQRGGGHQRAQMRGDEQTQSTEAAGDEIDAAFAKAAALCRRLCSADECVAGHPPATRLATVAAMAHHALRRRSRFRREEAREFRWRDVLRHEHDLAAEVRLLQRGALEQAIQARKQLGVVAIVGHHPLHERTAAILPAIARVEQVAQFGEPAQRGLRIALCGREACIVDHEAGRIGDPLRQRVAGLARPAAEQHATPRERHGLPFRQGRRDPGRLRKHGRVGDRILPAAVLECADPVERLVATDASGREFAIDVRQCFLHGINLVPLLRRQTARG